MSGEERRGKIIQALKNSDKAVSATTLAKEFDVSRQVIVLFHSSDITSKPKRYISKKGGIVHEFFWIGKAFCVQKARKKYSLIVDCFCNQYLASCRCGEQKCQY